MVRVVYAFRCCEFMLTFSLLSPPRFPSLPPSHFLVPSSLSLSQGKSIYSTSITQSPFFHPLTRVSSSRTGCPTMVDAADKITVAYSAKNIYTFTQMNCFGINRWANPATVSETGETEDPTDVFFGLIMLAPGISMFLGLFYVFFFGILWLLAFVGAIQNDHTKINLFRHWSHRALILNIIIMFGNVFSAAFMIIRQGANVYSVNKTWLCASFAKLNWPMCSYVYGFTVYSIIFTILNLIAISMAKGVVREITNENKGEDDDMEVMIE
eukprot:TRINITY_DN10133_c0_g1_i3.p1 TRINITY_DN10133_c0_g1~~TRINITY_DN10133_c0_g1_i3.p1  ORF type:complete len:268 (+),score=70.86 TRINITY_DN10133_c0_g1_i3:345-1148(+)